MFHIDFSKLKKIFSINGLISLGYNSGIQGNNNKVEINVSNMENYNKIDIPEDVMDLLNVLAIGGHLVVALNESGYPEQVNVIYVSSDKIGQCSEKTLYAFNFLKKEGFIYEVRRIDFSLEYAITEAGRKVWNKK